MKFSTIAVFGILSLTSVFAQLFTNGCIQIVLGAGTGCQWACNYCASMLNTSNYYFNPPVCTYQTGLGCVGNPQAGVSYSCCSL